MGAQQDKKRLKQLSLVTNISPLNKENVYYLSSTLVSFDGSRCKLTFLRSR